MNEQCLPAAIIYVNDEQRADDACHLVVANGE